MSEPLVAERRLAVVGAGPRGVMLLERILARLEGAAPDAHPRRLRIDVVDPYPPGPGRVWRTDQSELYLMNNPAFFPTACAADNPGLRPSTAAQTFDQWRRVHPEASLGVRRHQYPARAVYGRYLRHLYKDVVAGLRARPEVVEVLTGKVAIQREKVDEAAQRTRRRLTTRLGLTQHEEAAEAARLLD